MKHSDFTSKYHWMNGLSEYYRFTGQEEKFEPIFKALYHNNYHRKRDIIMDLIENNYYGLDEVTTKLKRSWINMLLNEHFPDIEVKTELITSLIAVAANDPFVDRIVKFINYFTFHNELEHGKGELLMLPDLGDFLSRGQVKSKLWLVTELSKIVEGSLGNVLCYGGWYNFLAHFLFSQFRVNKLYTIDLDSDVIEPSNILYGQEVMENRFFPVEGNVNEIEWKGKEAHYICYETLKKVSKKWDNHPKIDTIKQHNLKPKDMSKKLLDKIDLVINTSCEHMDNTWFENLPAGTFVVLHQNDYFDNEQHINCCKDLEDVKSKYPMQSIYYEGELDTNLYNRFMLIGVK